jgi:protein-disulfide isomerase
MPLPQRSQLWTIGYVGAIVVVLVFGVILFAATGHKSEPNRSKVATLLYELPQNGIELGKPDAPVTIVEFADLQCPACRYYALEILPTLLERYVARGKVRMELYLVGALGRDSVRAAQVAAGAATQDHLWQFVDAFYRYQGHKNSGYVTTAFLKRIAHKTPGLDSKRALAHDGMSQKFFRDSELAAMHAQVVRFPTFLIGRSGQHLEKLDIRSFVPSTFTEQIDHLLKAN